ncbi:hypothetical protein D1BOALGB6SA_3922 [Olavius sp. associated proteobacterium Delta 1]|nr:hypothetical protein D1BOALGB6SA_3922 [Olavius sp. associated proteobacterium Delta 1]
MVFIAAAKSDFKILCNYRVNSPTARLINYIEFKNYKPIRSFNSIDQSQLKMS